MGWQGLRPDKGEAGPPIQAWLEQTRFSVTKARKRGQEHSYRSHAELFAAPALGWLAFRMQVGLPRKQAGLFQISLSPNCCPDWFWANHFVILNLPFPHL